MIGIDATISTTSMEEAQRNNRELPVTRLVDQYYAEVQKRGGGKLDTSSLMLLLDHH